MADKEQRVEGSRKSFKKLIIIAIGLIALVLAGSAATYFFMTRHLDHVENTDQTQDKKDQKAKNAETFYYDLNKPLIVDFPRGSRISLIQISLSFLVEGEATLEALKKHDPMIRNNLLMLISAEGADSLNTHEGKDKLRADILAEVGSVLKKMTGENHVKEVFFTSFVMQ